MKGIKYYICILLSAITCGSCDQNETPVFDTNYSALNIWFGTSGVVNDDMTYNYSYTLGEDSIMFYARVTGALSDKDREFTLEVYEGNKEEAEGSYRTLTYVIKAGESEAEFPIYFDTSKLKDPQSFTIEDGYLYFRMAENPLFQTGAYNMNSLKVILKNYLDKPTEWDEATYPRRPYSAYFGEYSKVKYQFMIQELGLIDFHISYTATVSYDEETNTVSNNYANFLVQKMKVALEEYNSTHTEPLKDESGSVIVF